MTDATSLQQYIHGDDPICREERQYTLYLSSVLRYYGQPCHRQGLGGADARLLQSVFALCGIAAPGEAISQTLTVRDVYYDAALMRDYFERNRRMHALEGSPRYKAKTLSKSFNYRLLCYAAYDHPKRQEIMEKLQSAYEAGALLERNYGHDIPRELLRSLGLAAPQISLVQHMMNAKPDLAVHYREGGTDYLCFLECKLESEEASYDRDWKQTTVQGRVAEFMTDVRYGGYLTDVAISPRMQTTPGEPPVSLTVRFGRTLAKKEEICITDLLHLEQRIYACDPKA